MKRSYFPFDLRQQIRHLGGVLVLAIRHRRRDKLAVIVDTHMPCLPAFGRLLPVFLGLPFPWAASLQAATVHAEREGPGATRLPCRLPATVAWRRDSVVCSGQGRPTPMRGKTAWRNPAVWRRGKGKSTLRASAVSMARPEAGRQ